MVDNIDRLRNDNRRLKSLIQITQTITGILEIEVLATRISKIVCKLIKADRCYVFLYNKKNDNLQIQNRSTNDIIIPSNKGIAGHVFKTGETINISDVPTDSRFDKEFDQISDFKVNNVLAVAMNNSQKAPLGVILVYNKNYGIFSHEDEELVESISSISAISVENIRTNHEIERSYSSLIKAISATLDKRDYISFGHSQRVTMLAVQLAEMMKLDKDEIEQIRYAGLLHDIGKLGVPEPVLSKNTTLNAKEYRIIKGHASYSEDILNSIYFQKHLSKVPEIAACHHEKIDGSGYPKGLKGDDIPLGGKILAVCDVFDALTSRRSFKDRMPVEKAVGILDNETGTSYEPFVVYHFKNIKMDFLLQTMEFGHADTISDEDLELLSNYTLQDLAKLRSKTKKTRFERHLEMTFIKYYQRDYIPENQKKSNTKK